MHVQLLVYYMTEKMVNVPTGINFCTSARKLLNLIGGWEVL